MREHLAKALVAYAQGGPVAVGKMQGPKFSSASSADPTDAQLQKEYADTKARYVNTPQWLKAPNGKASNLNERQWVMVRTPRFKAWFGDWEILQALSIDSNGISKTDAEKKISRLRGKPLLNTSTGITAQVNRTQADKLVSNAAVNKSLDNGFTREQHYAITSNIDALWENAVLISKQNDKSGDPNITAIRRFAVPVMIGEDRRYVAILAKESLENGHRIYTLEAHGEKSLRGMLDALDRESGNIERTPARSADSILVELDELVNPGTISRVVDKNGEPRIVHHGSQSEFTAFDLEADNRGVGAWWFSNSPGYSSDYFASGDDGKVLRLFLSVKNPMVVDIVEEANRW